MAAYRYSEKPVQEKEIPPNCSQECIWYERQESNLNCANRYENICSLHRTEIFKVREVSS